MNSFTPAESARQQATASSSDYLGRVMNVMDRVEQPAGDLRTRLMQSTQAVFDQQAVPVEPQAIAQAVDAHLLDSERDVMAADVEKQRHGVEPVTPLSEVKILKAAWNRPTSMEEHARRITPTTRKERFFWWLGHRHQESEIAGTWEPRWATFLVLQFGVPALGAALGAYLFGVYGYMILGVGLFSILLPTLNYSATGIHFRVTENRKAKKVQPWELRNWASVPEAQAYAKACLNSAVPMILSKDREHLDMLWKKAETIKKAARQKEKERLDREKDDAERQALLMKLKAG